MDTSSFDNVFKTIEECFNRLQLSQSWVIKKVKTPEMVVIYRSTAVTQQLVDFQQQLASETQHDDYKPLLPEVKTEKDFDILPNNSVTDSRDANNLFREVEKKESEVVCTDPQAFNEPVLSIEENQNGDTISQRTSLITRKRTLEESQPRSLPQKKMSKKGKNKDPDFKCPLPPKLRSKPAKKKKDDDPDFNYDETVLQAINEAIKNRPGGRPLKYPELRTIKPNGEGLYKCPKCDQAVFYQTLTKHYKTHLPGKKFPCSICQVLLKDRTSLLMHEDLYHNNHQGKHQCHKCEKQFRFRSSLKSHITREHESNSNRRQKYKCLVCLASFASLYKKQEHLIQVHKDDACPCQICHKAFDHEDLLRSHIKHIHPKSNILKKCEFCEKTFATEKALHFHQDQRHEDKLLHLEKSFICPVAHCQKTFRKDTFLGLHLQASHKSETTDGMDISKYSIDSTLMVIKQTNQSETDGKVKAKAKPKDDSSTDKTLELQEKSQTQCTICGKLVSSKYLSSHMNKKHVETSYSCLTCDKTFANNSRLVEHNLDAHSNRFFTCPMENCGKTFKKRKVLQAHLQGIHTNKMRHQCSHCIKTFSLKADLLNHIKAVHEGKKELCSVCAKEFIRPSERNRHERDVHGVKREILRS